MTLEPLDRDDPTVIDRYRILGIIGSGGMGRVLLGAGPDGRLVAIKQIRADLVADSEFRARFRREVHASAQVSGAYTAAVINADVEGDMPWLASLFVPGVPLDATVRAEGRLGVDSVRILAAGLASALNAIHHRGLIHRDLKPGNVILAADGPKVIDFGIARAYAGRSELTHTGSVIGSPAYMSPEQAQSLPLTPASDVFALGTVLVMAATGRNPFAGVSVPNTLYNIVHTEPDLSELPPDLHALLAPCLHKNQEARPTPDQILDYLHPLPISARPWSPNIHQLIDEQERALRDLLADPSATLIRPAAVEYPSVAGEPTHRHRARWPRRTRVATGGALAVTMALVLLVIVVARGGGGGGTAAPNPLADLSLADMRTIDTCAVLKEVVTPPPDSAAVKPDSWDRCYVERDRSDWVSLEFDDVSAFHDSGRTVDGTPVLELAGPSPDRCSKALRPATMNPQIGIIVNVSGTCEKLDQLLPGVVARLRDTPPQIPDARDTLAVLDPCAIVDQAVLDRSIGNGTTPSAGAPHRCSWIGTTTLYVRVSLGNRVDVPENQPIDLGQGVTAYGSKIDATPCRRYYQRRAVGADKAELVEVSVTPSGGNVSAACTAAENVLRSVVTALS